MCAIRRNDAPVVFGIVVVLFMGLRQHGTQVVVCMRGNDTVLSSQVSPRLSW